MPIVDMPLEELRVYKGCNPRPRDFDEFWDKSVAEMEEQMNKLDLVIEKSDFEAPNVECYDMYFNGTRNGRVYSKLLKPKNAKGKLPAVLLFHGYTGAGPEFAHCLGLAGQGYVVAAMDCRGQGGRSYDLNPVKGNTFRGHIIRGIDDIPENMYFRNVYLDTAILARIVMGLDYVDETRVCSRGGSQGGALTLACAALTPMLKLAVADYPFLCDYKRVWEMDIPTSPYIEIRDYFRAFDPNHQREEEIFTRLGYIDIQYLAPRIKAEVLMQTGLMDNVCPPSTQFAAYNKISSKKSVLIYHDFGHEGLKNGETNAVSKIFSTL